VCICLCYGSRVSAGRALSPWVTRVDTFLPWLPWRTMATIIEVRAPTWTPTMMSLSLSCRWLTASESCCTSIFCLHKRWEALCWHENTRLWIFKSCYGRLHCVGSFRMGRKYKKQVLLKARLFCSHLFLIIDWFITFSNE